MNENCEKGTDEVADPKIAWPAFWEKLDVVLTHDGSRTLRIPGTDITFHSTSGAVTESREVFLRNSGLFEQMASGNPNRSRLQVLEIGFGTGLNFLLAADHAIKHSFPMEYTAIENCLIPNPLFRELGLEGLVESDELVPGLERLLTDVRNFENESKNDSLRGDPCSLTYAAAAGLVRLILRLEDYRSATLPERFFDVIFFDPFGPEAAAESWTADFAWRMGQCLKRGGQLVTYCVKSVVQRAFRDAGFSIKIVPGPPGGKRQVMIATNSDRE